MSNQMISNAGDAVLVRALFQSDPSLYEDYWYGSVRPAAPGLIRRAGWISYQDC